MSGIELTVAAELKAHNGVTTLARLRALGISERTCRTLVARGRLERVARGVFVGAGWPDGLDHRVAVACAITGGVVCFPTAGTLWDLRKTPRSDLIHLWVHEHRRIDAPDGVRVHRTSHLPKCDIVRRPDGSRVTSPPRTAFDAAALLGADDLESLVEQCLERPYFLITTLWAVARRTGERGRAGSGRIAEVIGRRPPWRRPVESDYELRLERAMLRRGFPPLERQTRLELATGEIIHPDLGVPAQGFYVEVDHLSWHGGRHEAAYDCDRDLRVRASGFAVERVTNLAIDHDLDPTIERLWEVWQRKLRS